MSFMGRRTFLSGYLPSVTVNGNLTMGSGKRILADPGTSSATGIGWTNGDPGTGWSSATADAVNQSRAAVTHLTSTSGALTAAVALSANTGLTVAAGGSNHNTSMTLTRAFCPTQIAIQTSNYQILTSDYVVPMNVAAGGTATLPVPTTPMMLEIMNYSGNSLTVARNTKTINGAAADITVLTNTGVRMQYFPATNDWRIISRSAVV